VGAVSGHGFHPSKAQPPCQFTNLNLSGPRGALQDSVKNDPFATWARADFRIAEQMSGPVLAYCANQPYGRVKTISI
jgi:hypothetical protein